MTLEIKPVDDSIDDYDRGRFPVDGSVPQPKTNTGPLALSLAVTNPLDSKQKKDS